MEAYKEEIRTPPLALVALLGRPDLQAALAEFLLKEQRPPLATCVPVHARGRRSEGTEERRIPNRLASRLGA